MDNIVASMLFATIVAGTPLIITALGELITEKSGVLNLGAEGIMAVGAIAAFAVAHDTHSTWAGVVAGLLAGAAMSLIFAVITLTLMQSPQTRISDAKMMFRCPNSLAIRVLGRMCPTL